MILTPNYRVRHQHFLNPGRKTKSSMLSHIDQVQARCLNYSTAASFDLNTHIAFFQSNILHWSSNAHIRASIHPSSYQGKRSLLLENGSHWHLVNRTFFTLQFSSLTCSYLPFLIKARCIHGRSCLPTSQSKDRIHLASPELS